MSGPAPVVLIGAARSGTKFLRDVLAAGSGTAAVPYDVNYVWRAGQEEMPHDALDPNTARPMHAARIRARLVRLSRAAPDDVLIEKTVSNTLRVPFVERVLPGARYIHLVRDGRDVVESAMRQWSRSPDWAVLIRKLMAEPLANTRYALWFSRNLLIGRVAQGRGGGKVWGPRYPGIGEDVRRLSLAGVCARQWAESVRTARRDLAALPPDRVFTVRYEALTAGPEALSNLLDGLALPKPERVLEAWRDAVRPQAEAMWLRLPEADRASIDRSAGTELRALGYGYAAAPRHPNTWNQS